MFHSFAESDRSNLEAICGHIARHFEPVSLSTIVDAIERREALPENAITVTVDDGYRNFLLHGHPVFRRHRIPSTLYAVAGFSEGLLWLWPDQLEYGLRHTTRDCIRVTLGGNAPRELAVRTPEEKSAALSFLSEALKEIPNDSRLAFLAGFGGVCGVEIPPHPPAGYEAMSWEELRAVSADGVEIGCHTETHPILSRLSNPAELESEILGAKRHIETRLGLPVCHFCYPNGRAVDISDAVIRSVREAGFASAASTTWGLNTSETDRFRIRRTPFDSGLDLQYGEELLAGLHM